MAVLHLVVTSQKKHFAAAKSELKRIHNTLKRVNVSDD
jgi:hypothetical protein